MTLSFAEIFDRELDVVNFRRRTVAAGEIAARRSRAVQPASNGARTVSGPPARKGFLVDRADAARDRGAERVRDKVGEGAQERSDEPAEDQSGQKWAPVDVEETSKLTGIALSGGGIRSASFCLGVLQALDSLSKRDEPKVLDAVDYLSSVSGGSYIGVALVAGLMQEDYSFPFESRLDEQEGREIQHLRNFANFLAPNGAIDYLVSAALLLRGLLVNAIVVLPWLLLLAVATVACNPTVDELGKPDFFGFELNSAVVNLFAEGVRPFALTLIVAVLAALLMVVSTLVTSLTGWRGTLVWRERFGRTLGWTLAIVLVAAFAESQVFVLRGMMSELGSSQAAQIQAPPGPVHDFLVGLGRVLPSFVQFLAPAAVALIAAAQKLANVAKAALGEATWSTFLKKHTSWLALYLAAVVVPLALWIAYLYLCAAAIRMTGWWSYGSLTPQWLLSAASAVPQCPWLGPVATLYFVVAVLLIVFSLFIGPNANSLHSLYRDRLSRAFLVERQNMVAPTAARNVDRWTFSSLKEADAGAPGGFKPGAALSPYLLVNTAINLERSRDLKRRGRKADLFTFSPLHVGSRATGYAPTTDMERKEIGGVTLATAMATSGAAASANMGNNTVKPLTFSLSLLNVRLGYWLANPARLKEWSRAFYRGVANVGVGYFAAETAGRLNENRLNVYLTDGGHIENLGVYDLLARRCKVIVAVDAEADADMTFPSLVRLQLLARIDMGVRIDLPWQALQKSALAVTGESLRGAGRSRGPHAAIGIIHYGDTERGVLIYIKSSLSGDENDYILDYKRRNSTFPHETTLDQFFSEEQFEVYRALGFHAARGLLTGADDFAKPDVLPGGWLDDIAEAFLLLNVPEQMTAAIIGRI